jgi:hypothetical protein
LFVHLFTEFELWKWALVDSQAAPHGNCNTGEKLSLCTYLNVVN